MSGIVGVLRTDGGGLERSLLDDLTDSMAFRGPDRRGVWTQGSVGLGHSLLATTWEATRESQPYDLGGRIWITADARIDARSDLIRELGRDAHGELGECTDPELILHAYERWGEDCVLHILGDFAFAIWDVGKKSLFCARDHFGIKPFYYARADGWFAFGNTLQTLRRLAWVDDELDELSVADFLMVGHKIDPERTMFAGIQRLPQAHCLVVQGGQIRRHRYWRLAAEKETRYGNPGDYVDRFLELLDKAAADRCRSDRVMLMLSGGLDSTTVGVALQRATARQGRATKVEAITVGYDHFRSGSERPHAELAARHLGIPVEFLAMDEHRPFDWVSMPDYWTAEPHGDPLASIADAADRHAEQRSRVVFTGTAGDILLQPATNYLVDRLRARQFWSLLRDAVMYIRVMREFPRFGLRRALRNGLARQTQFMPTPEFPPEIEPGFAARLDLRERWEEYHVNTISVGCPRPEVRVAADGYTWPHYYECADPGFGGRLVEHRDPLSDIRVAEYLASLPSQPFCTRKTLLRLAGKGILPGEILNRPKAAVEEDVVEKAFRLGLVKLEDLGQVARNQASGYAAVLQSFHGNPSILELRALNLAYWLQRDGDRSQQSGC